jgi:hypothetical protein
MKAILYVLFAALVLVSAIYVLKPKDEPPEIVKTPKQDQPPLAAKPDNKPAHEAVKEEKPMPAKPHATPKTSFGSSAKQGDLLKAPKSLPFDSSEAPDFPPLSPLEDDALPSFDDFPTQGFGDDNFATDDFGTDDGFMDEGEGWDELDSGELDSGELR